jgi:hypothetical protein
MPKPEDIIETNDAVVFYVCTMTFSTGIWLLTCIVPQTDANGTTASGFPWINEYIFRIRFDNQDKIVSVDEFTDSTVVLAAFAKETAAAEAINFSPNL